MASTHVRHRGRGKSEAARPFGRRAGRNALIGGAAGALVVGTILTVAPSAGADPTAAAVGEPEGFASMSVLGQDGTTGGAGGPTVTVGSADEFIEAAGQEGPLVIQVDGMIELPGPMQEVTSDKTLIGVGSDSGFTGAGLNIGLPLDDDITDPPDDAVHNVIVQNLTFEDWEDDAINVQMFSHHIWLDHNTFVSGSDGALDVKRGSSFVTVSWNHSMHGKNMLLGHDDDNSEQDVGRLNVTYHNNFFDGTDQRNPRARFGDPVHVYNNYYLDVDDYGVASTEDAGVLVEANYFENVDDPFHLGEGSSGDGNLEARDNCFENSGDGETGGSVAEIPYDYTVLPCADVPSVVTAGAGAGNLDTTPPDEPGDPDEPDEPGDPVRDELVGWAAENGGTTGGADGETVTVTDGDTLAELLESDEPLTLLVDGELSMPDGMNDVASDKTIIGVGTDSGLTGAGLKVSEAENVIIRNMNFDDWDDDAIVVQEGSTNVWIDHNFFGSGDDGSVDVKSGSDFVTISWNHTTHDKNMLLGHTDGNGDEDGGHLRVTYHHNWFDGSAERNPRVRHGNPVHVFNNYLDNNEIYGVASTEDAGVLVEGNYFENVPAPTHVGYMDSGPGDLVERDNVYDGSGEPESTGTGVGAIPYDYSLDPAADVPSIVTAGAGPQAALGQAR
ncbi:right-handed parallel beta-helix repeat-containing protein [Streptomyces sp. MP131-18]|uniref:pectate lyase family protein n=1 Tax=Streptomyces sp. MP131-18 TaxID=1857892 RepID=UPI0009C8E4AD|nr:right-handed parallel beta-helix repeat-containing protein [Streptomyces sp. MP131-18]ONK11073.1 Pectate trisaccharide-lyase precursor [Streptomyces sp. MP131-18]